MAFRLSVVLGSLLFGICMAAIGIAWLINASHAGTSLPAFSMNLAGTDLFAVNVDLAGKRSASYWTGLWIAAIGGELLALSAITFNNRKISKFSLVR